ncbi:hypothetical protein MVEN_00242400 [Mycena venus]|uniref:Heme peroxidase n=1 Tax=Mycena venus TaxID=2733690 RepID=A0A8H6Z1K6_9AGAR|nr:hypothetical protein MVEN_00242400 [Mycena venus]
MPVFSSCSGFQIYGGNFYEVGGDVNLHIAQATIEYIGDSSGAIESGSTGGSNPQLLREEGEEDRVDRNTRQRVAMTLSQVYKHLPHPPSTSLCILPANAIKYAYRNTDGSNYIPYFPDLGKANTPYSRSVPATNFAPPSNLPDAELVFDTLLSRDEFVAHPGGISSLFFAFANLIIHSVCHTDLANPNINLTSSYLDLSILYGNSQQEQDGVRNKDGRGCLYEDVFADSRLLYMPPSVGALLYSARKILEINEQGTYKTEFRNDLEKIAQDDEIFNRARLVNYGYFMQIILGDYVGAILGLVRDGHSWRLNPLLQLRDSTHKLAPQGGGNVVSIEFTLLYRWHAALSKQDTEWTENLYKELFEGKDLGSITVEDFTNLAHQKMRPDPDPRKWTFGYRLQRCADGQFKDSDLAHILLNATSWRAGAYKARGIPEVLRVIEVLQIEQARRWQTCSMNDFRRFIGLKLYTCFQEWNPDSTVHAVAADLYGNIENLELYVGLQAETFKPPMAGAGLGSGYTISRSILADIICLTRADPFLTVHFTPSNLTTWGYRDCQFDTQDGSYGGMLTKLLFRTLPTYYPPRSAYAHFPFLDPVYMRAYMTKNTPALADRYIWTRPTLSDVIVVKTATGVREILKNRTVFPTEYVGRLQAVTGHEGVNHAFVAAILLEETDRWATYFATETQRLIKQGSRNRLVKSGIVRYVDRRTTPGPYDNLT